MSAIEGVGQVTKQLFIAGARAICSVPELRAAGVTHVLKHYFDDPFWPDDITVLEHPVEDGVFIPKDMLEPGFAFIRSAQDHGQRVLVVCQLGVSRSSTFVLASLPEQGYDLHDAFRLLRSVRPQAWPPRALWTTLLTHYPTPYALELIEAWAAVGPG